MDRSAYDAYFELEQRHFWPIARRALVLDLVRRHAPRSEDRLRMLDVGGACSLVSRELARLGELIVVEPDRATVELARRELGLDVREGRLPDQLPVEGDFDVVTLLDVIEHVEDDRGALRVVRERLRPGGLLLVTVPALPWLWSNHDVANHHVRRYVRSELRSVVESAGLVIERTSYFSSLLFPLIAAQRVTSRLRGIDEHAKFDVKVPPRPLNALLLGVMSLENRLLERVDLPIGSSLLAVCRRATTR